jgi:hypothetical protein
MSLDIRGVTKRIVAKALIAVLSICAVSCGQEDVDQPTPAMQAIRCIAAINSAQKNYSSRHGGGYANADELRLSLPWLPRNDEPSQSCGGYRIAVVGGARGYSVHATFPVDLVYLHANFFSNESNVIRRTYGSPASIIDPEVK